MLRRVGIALAGVAVAALTGAACALSFDDLRLLAMRGEARPQLAYLYPAGFDALLAIALISVLLLRSARLLVRLQASILLALLIVAAAAANVATALRIDVPVRPAAVGVAVAPWVMLALGLWLWLLLIRHVQDRRAASGDGTDDEEDDLVPFRRTRTSEAPPPLAPPAQPVLEPMPVVGPTPAPETPPVSEQVTSWPAADSGRVAGPADDSRTDQETAVAEDGEESRAEAAPSDGPSAADRERAAEQERAAAEQERAATRERAAAEREQANAERERAAEQERAAAVERETPPVRWGDRVKPTTDVLVHPRPAVAEKDADTQPVRVYTEDQAGGAGTGPDVAHGPEAADPGERAADAGLEDTAPHPVVLDDAPARRLRSTPLPPED
jgi:hypothetical protein